MGRKILEGKSKKFLSDEENWGITLIPVAIGLSIIIFSFFVLRDSVFFAPINLIAAMVILGPTLWHRYMRYQEVQEIENRFPDFMAAVVEKIKAGMTLPQAIKEASKLNFGALSPSVRKMGVQLDWGIPFEKILLDFADNADSKILKRTAATVIETHRSGGNMSDVLEAVTRNIIEINKIKAERSARIYSQMITGYVIFFVFLGVMIGLQVFLIPAIGGSALGGDAPAEAVDFRQIFGSLIVIQGVFSGLAIGKIAEGSIVAGAKHSLALLSIGYTLFAVLGSG